MPQATLNSLRGCAAWGSISVEAVGKCLCCSVIGSALGKCQFVVDAMDRGALKATVQGVTGVGRDLVTRSPPPPLCADAVCDVCLYFSGETDPSRKDWVQLKPSFR